MLPLSHSLQRSLRWRADEAHERAHAQVAPEPHLVRLTICPQRSQVLVSLFEQLEYIIRLVLNRFPGLISLTGQNEGRRKALPSSRVEKPAVADR